MRTFSKEYTRAFDAVTDLLRCKWTLAILDAIERGINRPGRLERELPGLTTKVLNERIKKLENYGIIVKHQYPEIPPRVEYLLTERGRDFIQLLSIIRAFAESWNIEVTSPSSKVSPLR